jgi:preprotein translocase subunit SecD
MKNLRVRFLIIVATLVLCVYGIIGLPWPLTKFGEKARENLSNNIRLGLDLKGGSQLVMQVQMQDAMKTEASEVIDRLREGLNKKLVPFTGMDINDLTFDNANDVTITVKGVPPERAGDFRTVATDIAGQSWNVGSSGADMKLTLKTTAAISLRKDVMAQTMGKIERKIDALGLVDPSVQERGDQTKAEILVQLPGVDDPARIKQILGTKASLQWAALMDERTFGTREDALSQLGGVLPLNSRLMKGITRGGGPPTWYLVSRTPVVSGKDLKGAQPQQGDMGQWEASFTLSQEAAARFERFTSENIGKRAAIILDDEIISAPTIQTRISDQGRIMGLAGQQEAADLALNLRAGALPAGIQFLEERSVGPSLGAESIRNGMIAGVAGVLAVVLCMLVYYKKSGINATVALVLNAIILIAMLGYFGAVLTLPGIAGIILTIGMAVDSNVLIFERIREELRGGKGVVAAIDAGFQKAFLTIIDTHVTTVVSCLFLFIFGSTQVRGFAVTLVIGLLANVFTAVFVSKFIFDWELSGKKQVESLSI